MFPATDFRQSVAYGIQVAAVRAYDGKNGCVDRDILVCLLILRYNIFENRRHCCNGSIRILWKG